VQLTVSRDYLTIEGQRVPMSAPVAQAAVDSLDALLPTPEIVEAIEQAPGAVVTWLPTQPPGPGMTSAAAFARCERETAEILAGYLGSDTALLAGHRKDVVIKPGMLPGRVYIFGARWKHGGRIEVHAHGAHEASYADYSHGTRAVRKACLLDGKPARLEDVLAAGLCGGPVAMTRYPLTGAVDPSPAQPTPTPILRRGDRGPRVTELQTLLTRAGHSLQPDGIFGPRTEAEVRAFQRHAGLAIDGIAGPRTMAALRGTGDTERPPPQIAFIQAKNYRRGRARPIRAVVLHTAEIAEVPMAAENLAAWAAGPNAPMASWHYAVDADSIVQCVREEDTAFAAPGLNADGIQIELAARAAQDAAGWADPYSMAVLVRAAELVADICKRHRLPVSFVDADGLLRGERGVTTHAEVTRAYKRSTHTDPGKSFPLAAFLAAVREPA